VLTWLGKLGTYHITLHENHQPVINPARRIPHFLKDRLQQTLERNVNSGWVSKRVTNPQINLPKTLKRYVTQSC